MEPLIAATEPTWEESVALLDRLPSVPAPERAQAVERLLRNPSQAIRQRALRIGAALLPDERLVAFLREPMDDVVRNAGLEMLKLRGSNGMPLARNLLLDEDPDVVLQAILILDHLRDPRGVEPLRPILKCSNPNLVQAAIVALGRLGDARIVPDIAQFMDADPWLQMAAIQALGDLRSQAAVPCLSALLPDLLLGPMTAEALARIGGRQSFQILVRHWMAYSESLDAESFLSLLSHTASGLPRFPPAMAGFRASLAPLLETGPPAIRLAAAACFLALGPGAEDKAALSALEEGGSETPSLPHFLKRRKDLAPVLLAAGGPLRDWGLALVAGGAKAPPEAMAEALSRAPAPADLWTVAKAARRFPGPGVAGALLHLYLRCPEEDREQLLPGLRALKTSIEESLALQRVSGTEHLVLKARLGSPPGRVARLVRLMDPGDRIHCLGRLKDMRALMCRLPWQEWIRDDASTFAPLLAEAAISSRMPEAMEWLRPLMEASPSPEIIRAAGELGDRMSVHALVSLVKSGPPLLRIHSMEALGQIGGPEARHALAGAIACVEGKEIRMAYKALALCSTEEESPLFREAAANGDWLVRLACAEVIGRFPTVENLCVLHSLAADPVSAVAHKAQALLEIGREVP